MPPSKKKGKNLPKEMNKKKKKKYQQQTVEEGRCYFIYKLRLELQHER